MLMLVTTLRAPISTLFPYTTLFRSERAGDHRLRRDDGRRGRERDQRVQRPAGREMIEGVLGRGRITERSEEHTSELQSHSDLVCRLLLEKKNNFVTVNVWPIIRIVE